MLLEATSWGLLLFSGWPEALGVATAGELFPVSVAGCTRRVCALLLGPVATEARVESVPLL